jgi:AcrR family transcriptional regulator
MENPKIKEAIKIKAVEMFSAKGFHGTSIREIAKAAECSLPMLYYYYSSKNALFEEVAYNEFIRLTDRLNASITVDAPLSDIYFQAVKQRLDLNTYDKGVYNLSMKVWLGFDGSAEVRNKLMAWEKDRQDRTKKILAKVCSDPDILPVFSSLMVRVLESMMEKIILLDEVIPDEVIKQEISYMLECLERSRS